MILALIKILANIFINANINAVQITLMKATRQGAIAKSYLLPPMHASKLYSGLKSDTLMASWVRVMALNKTIILLIDHKKYVEHKCDG